MKIFTIPAPLSLITWLRMQRFMAFSAPSRTKNRQPVDRRADVADDRIFVRRGRSLQDVVETLVAVSPG